MSDTVGFGAPKAFGLHHFYVVIPEKTGNPVEIYEYFGFEGEGEKQEVEEQRVLLARRLWNRIRHDARREFNARLKAKKERPGSWKTGIVKLDRFLGRELCVLAWAVEHASPEECAVICRKWLALRPEERWWLYSKTCAEAGLHGQKDRGWRKALYCALSDGTIASARTKVSPKLRKRAEAELGENLLPFKEV